MTTPLPEQPVGGQYGLEPMRPELHEKIIVPPTSVDILTPVENYRNGSEFGGVAGIVQPPPHIPTADERRRQIMFIDPSDTGIEGDGSVQAPALEGDFQ